MKNVLESLLGFILLLYMAGCVPAGAQAKPAAVPVLPSPTANPGVTGCVNALALVKTLYDSNSAGQFDTSLALFTDDATFASWAQGINDHHMSELQLAGKDQIRTVLGQPGLVYTSGAPDAPFFKQSEVAVSGNQLTFMFRPDRLRPNGRQYNPYKVQVIFNGCKIKSLTVIELVTWL